MIEKNAIASKKRGSRFVYWLMMAWALIGVIKIVTNQLPLLRLRESVGNGDAYILNTVERFHSTGRLYPSLTPEHPVPTLYSPLVYLFPALAIRLTPGSNLYLGPRLLELLWFVACLAGVGLCAVRLIPARGVFWLGFLLAGSFSVVVQWILQLRGDFPGIACSLFALYFLTSKHRHSAIAAGIFAGLALQFKITFGAAAVAGGLWLLLYRRWAQFISFAGATLICSAGGYLLMWRFEPEMFRNILMLGRAIPDPAGVVHFIRDILAEPVVLLGLATLLSLLVPMLRQRWRRWQLLTLYLALSFVFGAVTALQAGSNVNYFYESLFAITPFAVLGVLRFRAARPERMQLFLGIILLTLFVVPEAVRALRGAVYAEAQVASRNRDADQLRATLSGVNLIATFPDLSLLSAQRILPETQLLNYRVLTSGADLSELDRRIRNQEFETVVTQNAYMSWRGIAIFPAQLRTAVLAAYRPYCLLSDKLFYVPKARLSIETRLKGIGCVECLEAAQCPGLTRSVDAFKSTQ